MGLDCREAGHRKTLLTRCKKVLASTAVAAVMTAGLWFGLADSAVSGGETRTISLYMVHTSESLKVTYMKNGKYIPSAMKKINYILRDWRRNEVITMDPKTIDLIWELHADLGSKRPIHIVSGYRSPKTNAFLKKVGRNVARKSQHMVGKAIDIYFPDIPTQRRSATAPWFARSAASDTIAAAAAPPVSSMSIPAVSATGDLPSAIRRWRRSCATTRRRSARAAARPT